MLAPTQGIIHGIGTTSTSMSCDFLSIDQETRSKNKTEPKTIELRIFRDEAGNG